jgi:hypothetical protein
VVTSAQTARTALLVLLAMALLLGACGGQGDDGRATATTAAAGSNKSGKPGQGTAAPETTVAGGPGCPAGGPGPSGRTLAADLDGDGRADRVWLDGRRVGVTTAAGTGSGLEIPAARATAVLGAEDADGDGRAEVFVRNAGPAGPGPTDHVTVAVFAGCRLRWVTNVQGGRYTFVVRSANTGGDGVGCVDADGDGRRDLVGLHAERTGDRVDWTRTIVRIDGTRATNGAKDRGTLQVGRDDARIETLVTATCGDNDFSDRLAD